MIENIQEGNVQMNLFFGPFSRQHSIVCTLDNKTQNIITPPRWISITKRDRTGRIRPVVRRKNNNTYYLSTGQSYTVSIKGKPAFRIVSGRSTYSVEKLIKK